MRCRNKGDLHEKGICEELGVEWLETLNRVYLVRKKYVQKKKKLMFFSFLPIFINTEIIYSFLYFTIKEMGYNLTFQLIDKTLMFSKNNDRSMN